MTPQYTPEHTGVAERANRTITEMVRCMLFDSRLGQEFWGYTALTAVHIINRLPSITHNTRTPFEIWFGVPPSINHLRIFGCTAYRHIPAPTRRKPNRRGRKCQFIGYVEVNGCRVTCLYDEKAKQVYITRDVVFDEGGINNLPKDCTDTPNLAGEAGQVNGNPEDFLTSNTYTTAAKTSATHTELGMGEEEANLGDPLPLIDPQESPNPEIEYNEETIVVKPQQPSASPNKDLPPRVPPVLAHRRSQRVHKRQEMFGLGAYPAFMAVVEDPASLQEVPESVDAVGWQRVWESELDSLRKNGTWVMAKVPKDRNCNRGTL